MFARVSESDLYTKAHTPLPYMHQSTKKVPDDTLTGFSLSGQASNQTGGLILDTMSKLPILLVLLYGMSLEFGGGGGRTK